MRNQCRPTKWFLSALERPDDDVTLAGSAHVEEGDGADGQLVFVVFHAEVLPPDAVHDVTVTPV